MSSELDNPIHFSITLLVPVAYVGIVISPTLIYNGRKNGSETEKENIKSIIF